ncbi:hypothetical protein K435DRAFT_258619 [Dendrothele bispora CBS 962.96]|uniref:Uncharacterized protein n=1 Tax=Dendrothele bispora (strain CBS 962.96) TaxID=1314807 RepID=A0A4S8MVY2_DENBC|nr:hypothetical protein K435DRAFT_258619 [Dendrothele bispora CBS 962.96]
MEVRKKVTSKLSYNDSNRPPSPLKSYVTSASSTTRTTTTTVMKPKAKVNSTATPASLRKPAKSVSNVSPPRPPSPSKLPKLQTPVSTQAPRIRATKSSSLRPATAQSTPSTPIDSRPRFGSVSLRPDGSPPPPASSIFPSSDSVDYLSDTAPRVKSKISKVAKHASVDVLSLYPSSPSGLPPHHRVRAPSISSATSSNNSGAPLRPRTANGTTTPRSSPPPNNHFNYQPFATSSPSDHRGDDTIHPNHYNNYNNWVQRITPKVDPASIPLPPHSPPASAVSFSSRSSVSRSSISHGDSSQTTGTTMSETTGNTYTNNNTNNTTQGMNGDLRSTLDTLVLFSGADESEVEEEDQEMREEKKVMHEAKSNRKIADLEITNRSLLAINSSLEATKHRQAKEIRELRRKLRESRLILPPRTYQAVTSPDPDSTNPYSPTDDPDDPDASDDDDTYLDKKNNKVGYEDYMVDDDDIYRRMRVRMNDLIETAQRALEMSSKDFVGVGGGKKVLSAEEVRDWRDSAGEAGGELDERSDFGEIQGEKDKDQERRTRKKEGGDGADSEDEEDEVEAMTIPKDSRSPSPSPTPDILVTHSP